MPPNSLMLDPFFSLLRLPELLVRTNSQNRAQNETSSRRSKIYSPKATLALLPRYMPCRPSSSSNTSAS